MEFEDEHDDEQEEEEEEEEEEGITIPQQPNYEAVIHNSSRTSSLNPPLAGGGGSSINNNNNTDGNQIPGGVAAGGRGGGRKLSGGGTGSGSSMVMIRYRECLKNHAVNIGGHAVDGCGEFMPAGEDGTLDALKCAACGCHRNFHRKEAEGELSAGAPIGGGGVVVGVGASGGGTALYPQFSPYYHRTPGTEYLHHVAGMTTPISTHHHQQQQQQQHLQRHHHQIRPLALPSASGGTHSRDEMDDMSHPSSSGGGGGNHSGGSGFMKKRFRTKFSQEQKDKMLAFAEKLGWRIQKHDEAAVQQFCHENQVRRQVFKVWMHNNKNTIGKKP